MEFEWDFRKADQNFRKHKVDFADAVIALEDINALTIEDDSHDERRFKTLALGPSLNVLLIVYFTLNAATTSSALFLPVRQTEVRPSNIIED